MADRHDYYKLDGRIAVPCSLEEMAQQFVLSGRRVAIDALPLGVTVSTVFLGTDHGYGDEPPLLFETAVFGGPFSDHMRRYSTWEEAEAGHAEVCDMVRRPPFFWLGEAADG